MPRGAQAAAHPVRPIIIIIILLMYSSSCVLGQEENAAEALLKFKSSLANADPALSNWNPSTTPCGNWIGVMCFNGYVWGLQLENMNLKGQIDVNSLVPLRFLRTLSFMNNALEGTMPDWRKLGALKSLFLSNNQFSGQIPADAFKGMTSLKKIHMANNKFTGPIPASLESPKLIELRLENNQFMGSIPPISSDNLKLLNVSNNQLQGPIPAPLLKMDPSSFSGLCGQPLGSECEPPPDTEPSLHSPPTTPPTTTSPPDEKKSSSLSATTIATIVLSIIVGLFLIIILVLLYRRRRMSQTPQLGRAVTPPPNNVAEAAAAATSIHVNEMKAAPRKGEQTGKLSFVRDDRQKFDLQDLMRASAEVLGSGNFGASYKAVLVDGEALVVKRFKQMNNIAKEDFHEHMRRLGRLQHPNLLPLIAYLYRKEEKLLVFNYVCNGSLAAHLHGKHSAEQPGLSWAIRLKIIKGVARGLAYLHAELPTLTVPHAHLKSSNVLLGKDFDPLLMDYTLVPVVNPPQVHNVLVAYKSPEYAQQGHTCKKTDVWCLGILILETLTGKFVATQGSGPYGPELAGWINAIVEEESTQVFDKEMEISCRPEMEKLLQIGIACCQEDLDKRLDMEQALNQIEQVQESFTDLIVNS
ncbi:hypothetical protein BUALT_Bualt02G0129400 [Buddleja alternifolia]|uniref:Protein kinase domain-containing protein n=1 Tax=Buddleja alternifolia TaxID=168488 RepID=A0AAV6Y1C3_9LAMI|nr:hypothetical protein BUALT_Bualt02G0129400 [Buddleja alternifolia]